MNVFRRALTVGAIVSVLMTGLAVGEVTVSITITGPVEELIPVLRRLQEMGLTGEARAGGNASMTLELHSVAPRGGDPDLEAEGEEAPGPVPRFSAPSARPRVAAPGSAVLVTVKVHDPEYQVDTVVATLVGARHFDFDLYDNGTKGDGTAGDGTWSYSLPVPDSAGAGRYTLSFKAYNRMGDPIHVEDGDGEWVPMTAETAFEVMPNP